MTIEFCLNWDGVSTPTWVDYTDWVDMTVFKRNKSLDANNDPQKSASAELEAFGDAYTELKTNLIDSSNRYSNFYAVRITEELCADNEYLFKIQNQSLKWCDNGECKIQFVLVEFVPLLDCIKRTTLADNSSGEFQMYPSSGTPHPRFRYCDVVKPTFMYGMIITMSNAVVAFIISINIALNSILGIIVWVVNMLGGSWSVPQLGVGFAEDLLGCSRGHPSPFVRTYIDNVCNICGVTINDTTAPILYDPLEDNGLYDNQYYNTCLSTAYTTKGIDMDGAKGYIPANQPSWTLDKLMSVLKVPFNARWFLKNGTDLYFERKDLIGGLLWGGGVNEIDFTDDDAQYLLGDVCYTYNGEGKPKRIMYNYGTDPTDNIGNELLRRFRGIHEDLTGNANYNETVEVTAFEFGAAACVLDGKDSAYDVNIVRALAGAVSFTGYGGCLKTQGDTYSLAKLIIWDAASTMEDARVMGNDYNIYGDAGADLLSFRDDDAVFFPLDNTDCKNYNYPFSFDPDAHNVSSSAWRNLWYFNQIDVPSASKQTNIDIEFNLQYCCKYNFLEIYQSVILQDGATEAEIYSIDFDHEKREIKVKAKLK